MFDPERDDDHGTRHFYRRLLVIAALAAVAAGVLWPSVSGFSGGPDGDKACVAILDGWTAERSDPGPSASIEQQIEFSNWQDSHPCVAESRHRLIWSASILVVLGGGVGAAVALGGKRNGRRDTALVAGGTTSG